MAPGTPVKEVSRKSPPTPCGAPKRPTRMRSLAIALQPRPRSGGRCRRGFRGGSGAFPRLFPRQSLFGIDARHAWHDAETVEQAGDAVGRLRALGDPRFRLFLVEHDPALRILRLQGIEDAEAFDEPSIARHPGIGDHDPIERPLLGAAARQTNFQWHYDFLSTHDDRCLAFNERVEAIELTTHMTKMLEYKIFNLGHHFFFP